MLMLQVARQNIRNVMYKLSLIIAMKVVKDGIFDNLHGQTISTPTNQPIDYIPGTVSSGTYAISFGELQWLNCTLTCQQARYVALGGTQIVSVSGKVVSTGTTINSEGRIVFLLPFPVPSNTQQIGGTSTVMNIDGSVLIPSACWFDPVPLNIGDLPSVILNVFPGSALGTIWFNVMIMMPIQ